MIILEPHRFEPDGQHCTYRYSDGTWCFEPESAHTAGGYVSVGSEFDQEMANWDPHVVLHRMPGYPLHKENQT